jgi:flagellar assembly protein FliH
MSDDATGALAACRRWDAPQLDGPAVLPASAPGSAAWQAGFERGRAEGLEAGREELRRQARQFEALVHTLAAPFAGLDEEVERQLVRLAIEIAVQLVRRELTLDSGLVVTTVREALALLPVAARQVRVFLHPADAELLREQLPGLEDEHCQIVEDPQLERGGCRISTDTSHVDATLPTRVSQVIATLHGASGSGHD